MTTLLRASKEWMRRPADERYYSVTDLHNAALGYRTAARSAGVKTHDLHAKAVDGAVVLNGRTDTTANLTNWSFNQLAKVAEAPAGYLQTLPAELAADCLNTGMHRADVNRPNALMFNQDSEGMLTLRALTSNRYSRIWNSDITRRLVEIEERGPWQPAPAAMDGARGLYMGDRDMFAFMVDNDRRVYEKGPGGGLSRGFFVWNSEVGATSFGVMTFFYNYICANHMVWGASGVKEVRIRHVGDANGKAFTDLQAELIAYANSSATDDELKIERMRTHRIGKDLDEILDTVLGLRIPLLSKGMVTRAHELAENRVDWYGDPNTVWGLAGGLTEIARDLPNANDRTALEAAAGKMCEIAF